MAAPRARRAAARRDPPAPAADLAPAEAQPSRPAQALAIGEPLAFGRDMPAHAVRLRNFDAPEDDFVWSMGRFAEVIFAAEPAPGALSLLVDLDVFRAPPMLAGQNVLVYLNGLRVHSAFVVGRVQAEMRLRPGLLEPEQNTLTFDLPDAIRPLEFGMDDGRMLGLKLFSLTLEAAA